MHPLTLRLPGYKLAQILWKKLVMRGLGGDLEGGRVG